MFHLGIGIPKEYIQQYSWESDGFRAEGVASRKDQLTQTYLPVLYKILHPGHKTLHINFILFDDL